MVLFLFQMQRMGFLPIDATAPKAEDPLATMLDFARFLTPQASRIREDGFDAVEDMCAETLEADDVKELVTTFSRSLASGHISFGISQTKRLIGIMHWVQDHESASLSASFLVGIMQLDMRDSWSKVLERAKSRCTVAKEAKATQAKTDPGDLKSDTGIYDWDNKWENCISLIPGQNGVPLPHLIRLDSEPDHQPKIPCSTFVGKSIGCAPRSGASHIIDKRKLHQLVTSYLVLVIHHWIEPVQKKQDDRESYASLKNHCLGTRNVSRRALHVDQMKKNLSCTDERRGKVN